MASFSLISAVSCGEPGRDVRANPTEPVATDTADGGVVAVRLVRVADTPRRLFSAEVSVSGRTLGLRDGETLTFAGLPRQTLSVEARNLTAGCGIRGDDSQTVRIAVDRSAEVTFHVACVFAPAAHIAVQRTSGSGADIWTVRPDGSALTRLTSNEEGYGPDWSPDGTRIAYRGPDSFIWVMNHDGSEQRRLSGLAGSHARWSPDGSVITFGEAGQAGAGSDIWTMSADGSDPVKLTDDAAANETPAWSPDGERIAFQRDGVLHVMRADGAGMVALARGGRPAWSPDGRAIAFVSSGPQGMGSAQIWSIRPDGTGLTRLTAVQPDCDAPSYRPDGLEILFHCPRSSDEFIWIMDADGTNQRRFDPIPGPGSSFADWFEAPPASAPVRDERNGAGPWS